MDFLTQTPLTMTTSVPVVAGVAGAGFSSTNAINFCIGGKAYTKAALSSTALTAGGDVNTGAAFVAIPGYTTTTPAYGAAILLLVDKSGNFRAAQGPLQALDSAGNFITAPQFPAVPDIYCPFAYLVVLNNQSSGTTWTLGTNNTSGVSNVTYHFQDLMTLPARPQV